MPKFKITVLAALVFINSFAIQNLQAQDISDQVIIRRTAYGVPHIEAKNIMAAGFALGYLQMEDYGSRVAFGLIRARGEWAKYNELKGRALENQLNEDAANQILHGRAVETYSLLGKDIRDMNQGFADGVNRYILLHSGEFPDWVKPDFTAYDVHATGIQSFSKASVKTFIETLEAKGELTAGAFNKDDSTPWASIALNTIIDNNPDLGSNAWALAPERTTSGKAILLRNPHLDWNAGYYEAQMDVEGYFNFYGDFRIGEPLGTVGGFNEFLGFSTTNNYPKNDEIYSFKKDPDNPDNYLLDGASRPVAKRMVTVTYKAENELKTTQKVFASTPFGPVIYHSKDKIYIIKSVDEGEYRTAEQFLKMMEAKNLNQWKDALRMQAKSTSNFTYADVAGNIFYVWNASVPYLKLPSGNDTAATFVTKQSEIWSELHPWDKLPQLLNPKGGYIHNENDPFYYTNLNEVFNKADFPPYFPQPKLGLRSQLAIQLIGGSDKLSLEEVVKRKYDMSMLLADRVKPDLIRFAEKSELSKKEKKALAQLKKWDNTVAKESVGGILFQLWWNKYVALSNEGKKIAPTPESAGFPASGEKLYSTPWSAASPAKTPYGLANEENAVVAFKWAVKECEQKYGTINLKWGDVYRAIIGKQDYPVGGTTGAFGAFRVLWYAPMPDQPQRMHATGGDGWILAVEFDKIPRAYSVLAYGESNKDTSTYFGDQLKMFTDKKVKSVFYTKEDIEKNTISTYHPGK
ncbi:MAG: penicillin acylase family protein [Bacteroidetes bacterium]|nr:penicillin acylase family protein [Bacteroidota bacterium]